MIEIICAAKAIAAAGVLLAVISIVKKKCREYAYREGGC